MSAREPEVEGSLSYLVSLVLAQGMEVGCRMLAGTTLCPAGREMFLRGGGCIALSCSLVDSRDPWTIPPHSGHLSIFQRHL